MTVKVFIFNVLHNSKAFDISMELIAVYDQDFTSCDYIIFRKQRPYLQIGSVAIYKVVNKPTLRQQKGSDLNIKHIQMLCSCLRSLHLRCVMNVNLSHGGSVLGVISCLGQF